MIKTVTLYKPNFLTDFKNGMEYDSIGLKDEEGHKYYYEGICFPTGKRSPLIEWAYNHNIGDKVLISAQFSLPFGENVVGVIKYPRIKNG